MSVLLLTLLLHHDATSMLHAPTQPHLASTPSTPSPHLHPQYPPPFPNLPPLPLPRAPDVHLGPAAPVVAITTPVLGRVRFAGGPMVIATSTDSALDGGHAALRWSTLDCHPPGGPSPGALRMLHERARGRHRRLRRRGHPRCPSPASRCSPRCSAQHRAHSTEGHVGPCWPVPGTLAPSHTRAHAARWCYGALVAVDSGRGGFRSRRAARAPSGFTRPGCRTPLLPAP